MATGSSVEKNTWLAKGSPFSLQKRASSCEAVRLIGT
jgi:hypothetical protein